MNEDFKLLIVIAFLVPVVFSPLTIDAQFVEEGTLHVLVEFEYPKNFTDLLDDIDNQLIQNFTDIGSTFFSNANFTSGEIQLSDLDEMLFDLSTDENGKMIYQLSPEIFFTGNGTLNSTEYNIEYNTGVSLIRATIIDFLTVNNGTHVMSWLEFSDNTEVVLDELF